MYTWFWLYFLELCLKLAIKDLSGEEGFVLGSLYKWEPLPAETAIVLLLGEFFLDPPLCEFESCLCLGADVPI